MATPNDVNRRSGNVAKDLTRVFVCLLGLAAIAWGGFTLPVFWQEASPRSAASKLLQGDTFKTQWLLGEAQQAETAAADRSFCNPTALRSLVILRLFILTESIAAKKSAPLADLTYSPLYDATRKSLSCAPADPFVWLALFWLDAGSHGFDRDNANYLRLSYALGPNESWIALWRNRLAFRVFEQLPPDLANDAVAEFVKLVDTGQLYLQTAGIFEDAPQVAQNRITEQLATAKATSRRVFGRTLHDRGLDVAIPGIERPDARPWK